MTDLITAKLCTLKCIFHAFYLQNPLLSMYLHIHSCQRVIPAAHMCLTLNTECRLVKGALDFFCFSDNDANNANINAIYIFLI